MLEVTLSGLLLTVNYANVLYELSVFEGLPAVKENRGSYHFAGFTWNTKNPKKNNNKKQEVHHGGPFLPFYFYFNLALQCKLKMMSASIERIKSASTECFLSDSLSVPPHFTVPPSLTSRRPAVDHCPPHLLRFLPQALSPSPPPLLPPTLSRPVNLLLPPPAITSTPAPRRRPGRPVLENVDVMC